MGLDWGDWELVIAFVPPIVVIVAFHFVLNLMRKAQELAADQAIVRAASPLAAERPWMT